MALALVSLNWEPYLEPQIFSYQSATTFPLRRKMQGDASNPIVTIYMLKQARNHRILFW